MSIRTARSSKRLIAAAVAVAVTASTFAISNTAGAAGTTDPDSARISGTTRCETAGAIGTAGIRDAAALTTFGTDWKNDGCNVVLVNDNSFADGLAAASLANSLTAVILLTEAAALPTSTISTLETLATANYCDGQIDVTIVGGASAVSNDVPGQLIGHDDVDSVNSVGGADRYATSLEVATAALGDVSKTVIIATGQNFPDALAAGVLAHKEDAPIILHDGSTPSAAVVKFLTDKGITDAYIICGTSAVPQAIEDALSDTLGIDVERLGGADRFATAVAVAGELGYGTGVVLASGRNFPDALAAAPLAAASQARILLVEVGSIPAATAAWHLAKADTLVSVWAVGGTSVVSAAVLTGATSAATAFTPSVTAASAAFTHTQDFVDVALRGTSYVTLSAVSGSATDGAAGNEWSVECKEVATAASGIAISIDADDETITVTVREDLAAMTSAQLVSAWNASAAADLFVAGTVTGGALGLTNNASFDSAGGTTVSTLVLTFNRSLQATTSAAPGDLAALVSVYDRNGPNGQSISMPPPAADGPTGTRLSTDRTALTIVFVATSDASEVPVVGTAEIRIAAGDVEAVNIVATNVNGTDVVNAEELTRRLVAA